VNRHQRRRIATIRRCLEEAGAANVPGRAALIRMVAELAAEDASISGATVFLPDGTSSYVDAIRIRKGGTA
jgi:hypothetical protein